MMYSPQDLLRDIPSLIGEDRVNSIMEYNDSISLLVKDKYGNEEGKNYLIIIYKTTGKVIFVGKGTEEDDTELTLECTGEDTNERYFATDARAPEEYATYSSRIIYELCDSAYSEIEGVQRLIAITCMMESTTFENIDYDAMKRIAIMYIKEFNKPDNGNIHEINSMTLEQKVEKAKEYV